MNEDANLVFKDCFSIYLKYKKEIFWKKIG